MTFDEGKRNWQRIATMVKRPRKRIGGATNTDDIQIAAGSGAVIAEGCRLADTIAVFIDRVYP